MLALVSGIVPAYLDPFAIELDASTVELGELDPFVLCVEGIATQVVAQLIDLSPRHVVLCSIAAALAPAISWGVTTMETMTLVSPLGQDPVHPGYRELFSVDDPEVLGLLGLAWLPTERFPEIVRGLRIAAHVAWPLGRSRIGSRDLRWPAHYRVLVGGRDRLSAGAQELRLGSRVVPEMEHTCTGAQAAALARIVKDEHWSVDR